METSKTETDNKILPTHHIQEELCSTRPLYRQGRKLTAVKVYTVTNESQHLIIYRVPKINLSNELKAQCMKFGNLKKFEVLTKYKTDIFTECYHVNFERIQGARIAKRFLDNKSFYGEILHVCYAPEFETLAETKAKLLLRQKDVHKRLEPGPSLVEYATVQNKRKVSDLPVTNKRLKTDSDDPIFNTKQLELNQLEIHNSNTNCMTQTSKAHSNEIQHSENIIPGICTTLLPTSLLKKYEHANNKRIVFKNKK